MIAPGERFDLVVDFAAHAGERIVLRSDAFEIMQFRVSSNPVSRDTSPLPATLRPVAKTAETLAIKTRRIPLVELKSPNGDSMTMLLGGNHWDMPVTENPVIDTVEIWELLNTTEDSHPIHLHLVRFQILDRRSFDEPLFFAYPPDSLYRAGDAPRSLRGRLERHDTRALENDHPHYRPLRGLHRPLCLALPCPRA